MGFLAPFTNKNKTLYINNLINFLKSNYTVKNDEHIKNTYFVQRLENLTEHLATETSLTP